MFCPKSEGDFFKIKNAQWWKGGWVSSNSTEDIGNLSRGGFWLEGTSLQNEEGKNWEGVRRSGSDVDIIPDVKTQISQRWFGSPLSQQRRRNDATIMVEATFLHTWRREGIFSDSLNPNHTLLGTYRSGHLFTLPSDHNSLT